MEGGGFFISGRYLMIYTILFMKKEKEVKTSTEEASTTIASPKSDKKKDYAGVEAKLKKDYGDITKIQFTVKRKRLTAYLREPSLVELDATLSSLSSAPISSSVGLFRSCFVGGDDELLQMASSTGVAIAIHREIQKIIPNVETTSQTL